MPGSLGPEVLGLKSSQRGQGLTLASQKSPVVSRRPPPPGGGAGVWNAFWEATPGGQAARGALFSSPWKDRQPGDTGSQRPTAPRLPSCFTDPTNPFSKAAVVSVKSKTVTPVTDQLTFKSEFFNPFGLTYSYIHVLMCSWQADLRTAPCPTRGFASWSLDSDCPFHEESSLTSPTPVISMIQLGSYVLGVFPTSQPRPEWTFSLLLL